MNNTTTPGATRQAPAPHPPARPCDECITYTPATEIHATREEDFAYCATCAPVWSPFALLVWPVHADGRDA